MHACSNSDKGSWRSCMSLRHSVSPWSVCQRFRKFCERQLKIFNINIILLEDCKYSMLAKLILLNSKSPFPWGSTGGRTDPLHKFWQFFMNFPSLHPALSISLYFFLSSSLSLILYLFLSFFFHLLLSLSLPSFLFSLSFSVHVNAQHSWVISLRNISSQSKKS